MLGPLSTAYVCNFIILICGLFQLQVSGCNSTDISFTPQFRYALYIYSSSFLFEDLLSVRLQPQSSLLYTQHFSRLTHSYTLKMNSAFSSEYLHLSVCTTSSGKSTVLVDHIEIVVPQEASENKHSVQTYSRLICLRTCHINRIE